MGETYHLSQMRGMRRLGPFVGVLGCCLLVTSSCNKPANTEGRTAASVTSEEVAPPSSGPSRSEIACRLHSCAPPYYCNQDKGVCEMLPCADSRDCPYGYKCDFSKSVCQ
ncbi:MAG: hypothetical protein JSU89_11715 [Myxococcales bacterium]|nr:MAG: hypothetical protein JSU89_11715 [Myxococcales bacterium]